MRSWIVLFAVLIVAAGCGGGGGGSSTPGTGISPGIQATPTPPIQTTAVQRALVQQALTSTSQTPTIASYAGGADGTGGTGSNITLATARRAFALRRSPQSVASCVDGQTSTFVAGATSDSGTITINQYYDQACTKLYWTGVFTGTETSTSLSLVGSYTYYTQAGVVYEYISPATITVGTSGTTSYASIGGTVANSVGAAPYESIGLGCSIGTATASCSVAGAQHISALSLDQATVANATATSTTTSTGATITLTGNGSSYSGPLNSLALAPQGLFTWMITGGAATESVTLNGSASFNSSGLNALALTVSDSADAATVSVVYNATTQLVTGTVAPIGGGGTVATFSVTPSTGVGTVTYSNGTTATIFNWAVTG